MSPPDNDKSRLDELTGNGGDVSAFVRLSSRIADFAGQRDWNQYHAPKNLAMALSVEASELVEIFQWMNEDESDALDADTRVHAADEIADVQIYLLQLATRLDIDIEHAVEQKLAKNALKYPAIDSAP